MGRWKKWVEDLCPCCELEVETVEHLHICSNRTMQHIQQEEGKQLDQIGIGASGYPCDVCTSLKRQCFHMFQSNLCSIQKHFKLIEYKGWSVTHGQFGLLSTEWHRLFERHKHCSASTQPSPCRCYCNFLKVVEYFLRSLKISQLSDSYDWDGSAERNVIVLGENRICERI